MLSVLINAYKCSPHTGSEFGMGWNWVINLGKYCNIHVITESEYQSVIESELHKCEYLDNIHFHFLEIEPVARIMADNQGDWRFYFYYRKWQLKAYKLAKELAGKYHFDIIHQLNMTGFREPGYLWRIDSIPFVWGPIDAKDKFPSSFAKDASIKYRLFIFIKDVINILQLKYSYRVQRCLKRANLVVAGSSDTLNVLKKIKNVDAELINETGCSLKGSENVQNKTVNNDILNILWVGKMDFRKQLSIALEVISRIKNLQIILHIIGGGDKVLYEKIANKLGLKTKCIFHGSMSHAEVQSFMRKSDLLLFTSLVEGTPHVVLEAIANNLPVLCFDCCGQGDSVNERIGIKIPVVDKKTSILEFSKKLEYLYYNRNILLGFSNNCNERKLQLSWNIKVQNMISLYNRVLSKNKKNDEDR